MRICRTLIAALAMMPLVLLIHAFLSSSAPPALNDILVRLGQAAHFFTLAGWARFWFWSPIAVPGDPVTMWQAYTAILSALVVLSVLVGGLGYLIVKGKPESPPASQAPSGGNVHADSETPPLRGTAFWIRWLVSLQFAPCCIVMIGAGPFRLAAGDAFNFLVAGLVALGAVVLCWVLGRDALNGRPGSTFRGGERGSDWADNGPQP